VDLLRRVVAQTNKEKAKPKDDHEP
jgi:hypothetical protein